MEAPTSTPIVTEAGVVSLVSPMPASWIPLLWSWLHEVPDAHFDDYSPTRLDAFEVEMRRRLARERSWGVCLDGEPVGVIGYVPLTPRLGVFHGLCFTEAVCGRGVARVAVSAVLAELFAAGVEKVCAYFFSQNHRVDRFFQKLGAVREGLQIAQTTRGGVAIHLRLVALFAQRKDS